MSKNQAAGHFVFWDDAAIEKEMEALPKALQEPYRWLKKFAREECGRDLDTLTTRAKLLGVTIDKTNWTRILKGRWKMDAEGNELPSPYVSAVNLLNAITALQETKRVELLQGASPFVETTTVQTIHRFIEKRMRRDRINRTGVITGPTSTQKSASFKELARRNPLIRHIESSDNGSLKDFFTRLAVKCGAGRSISSGRARSKIFEFMEPVNGNPKCLIVDNSQDMVKLDRQQKAMGNNSEKQPFYQFLRMLSDETNCAIIESITPESEDYMFDPKSVYLEQFEARAGGRENFLRLANYPPKADLVMIAETWGMKDAKQHVELLVKLGHTRLRIRRFFEILQEAKDSADADGSPLTADYLREAMTEAGLMEGAK